MNKKLKKGIGYSLIPIVLGGLATAITIPILNAKNKVSKYSTLDNQMQKDDYLIAKDLTTKQMRSALEEAGINDNLLLDKVKEQTTFFLYKEEQKGSKALQKLHFQWSQYEQLHKMRDLLEEMSNTTNNKKANKPDFDSTKETEYQLSLDLIDLTKKEAKFLEYENKYKKYVGLMNQFQEWFKGNANLKSRIDKIKSSLANFEKQWSRIKNKISKIDNNQIDYNSSNLWSDFPLVISSIDSIRGKKRKRFLDSKKAFQEKYATEGEGKKEWEKHLVDSYNGSTNDNEAIESLVYSEIKNSSFERFKYKINNSFTIEKYKSLIFENILGTRLVNNTTAKKLVVSNGDGSKVIMDEEHAENKDKVYFLGTKSKIIEKINLSSPEKNTTSYSEINAILNSRYPVKIQNAILPIKQGKNELDPWEIKKDFLKQLLTTYVTESNTSKNATDEWSKIFSSKTPGAAQTKEEIKRDKRVVGRFSGTKDSTQWKAGNLGYMTALDASAKMSNGFNVGMVQILEYIINVPKTGTKTFKGIKKDTFVEDFMKKIQETFLGIVKTKGLLGSTSSITPTKKTTFTIENNKNIFQIIDGLEADEITREFGGAIRDLMNNLNPNGHGIPTAIQISNQDKIYAVYSPSYGIHIVKIVSGKKDITTDVDQQLKVAAKDQDTSKMTTDFGALFTKTFTENHQIKSLLQDNEYKKYLNENIKNYKKVGPSIDDDVAKMINRLIKSSIVKRLKQANVGQMVDYLIEGFDKKIIDERESASVNPDDIYMKTLFLGGKNED